MAAVDELERGRESYARRAWVETDESLSRADRRAPLGPPDLERLATAAYMLGRDDDYLAGLERAHHAYLGTGETLPAVRCAFWIGMHLFMRAALGPGMGWLGRAQRIVEREPADCVERGYLLMPRVFQAEAAGDLDAAIEAAGRAADTGARFGDGDLFGLAVHQQGLLLSRAGRVDEGLGRLDEAMVAVIAGELSPIASGIVYCGVILGCQEVYELRRAQEWTAALERWTAKQPDMVAFSGRCRLHRAEIMQIEGEWPRALDEARRASRLCVAAMNPAAAAEAVYRQGDVHRLLGEFAAAEEHYRDAGRRGRESQPGLALLRLAQGDRDAAAAGVRRALGETTERPRRAELIPAYVEIMLAVGDVAAARGASDELTAIAALNGTAMLGAMAAHAAGAVRLAGGDAEGALVALRQACHEWQRLGAPYEAARARALVGQACRTLCDEDAALLELEAARDVFAGLGAARDVERVDEALARGASGASHGLTPRELQVLRLVASGRTNRSIAGELVLSERTVDRHVSNIYTKLRVPSRAAATAYAYEHGLV